MITTVRFSSTSTIHASKGDSGTICGSEVHRNAGSSITSIRQTIQVKGEVSCKRCIKLLASQGLEADATPVAAPAPVKVETWTCANCHQQRSTQPTERELRLHAKVCKGDLLQRALNMITNFAELAERAKSQGEHAMLTAKQLEAEELAISAHGTYPQVVSARRAGYLNALTPVVR